MAKEKKNMSPEVNVVEEPKAPAPKLVAVTVQNKQKVLNLDSMVEEEISVSRTTYSVPKEMTAEQAMAAAEALVSPVEKRLNALLDFASRESYATSKKEELAKGNFLTSGLKSTIVQIMGQHAAFAELKSADIFERWLAGFKAGKQAAIRILESAKMATSDEIADL